jgi:glutamate-1-semialdehyde 2,1-aminomutase
VASTTPPSFAKSEAMLERARGVIPLGTQTFSKSYTHYPRNASPFFIARGLGSRVWDVDGNEFLDFASALAAVTLGHCDPDVTRAVEIQLKEGTIFSLAHPLEAEVAERIVKMVPCAEMVRFGKNGSDATSGAIRVARAFTGRDHVAVCGYHGWQDWYIGVTSRAKGVPAATRALVHAFAYNDLGSLAKVLSDNSGGFAAVIVEPMNVCEPQPGFLQGLVDLAHAHGALAVFDETITGFRFALGGAQEYFNVIPDLATFGKGLANGYPLSAIAGRGEIMREFEEVFFSFTMGGETLSLAAAKAVLGKLVHDDVPAKLKAKGLRLLDGVRERIARYDCQDFLGISGHPAWSFLIFRDADGCSNWEIKTLWMQETIARGVLSVGTHNLMHAHSDDDIDRLLGVYDEVFPLLARAVHERRIMQYLRCKPLAPLFSVR